MVKYIEIYIFVTYFLADSWSEKLMMFVVWLYCDKCISGGKRVTVHSLVQYSYESRGQIRYFIDSVDTLYFWVLFCQKKCESLRTERSLRIKNHKPFGFFWHNKTQKERVSTEAISYLIWTRLYYYIRTIYDRLNLENLGNWPVSSEISEF